jgi:hypothetical protein
MQNYITILISLYAALLSTAVFVWNIINSIRDKGRIKIGGFFGHSIDGFSEPKKVLYFEFVNVGSKPITTCNFGGYFKKRFVKEGKKGFVVTTPGILKKLDPGDRLQVTFETFDVIDHTVKNLLVYDTTGKGHKMSNKLLRSLIKQKAAF